MFRKTLSSEIVTTIDEYTIVKSVEQEYYYDCTKCGKPRTWYDICLDNGDGDIVFSCTDLDMAIDWIKNY